MRMILRCESVSRQLLSVIYNWILSSQPVSRAGRAPRLLQS